MISSNGTESEVDYRAVCRQLQAENEDLRRWLGWADRLMESLEDIKHVGSRIGELFKKNPYLLVVVCYIALSIFDFVLRRRNNDEG